MALLICPECSREVSSYAIACPHCGCPTQKISAKNMCRIGDEQYDLSEILVMANIEDTPSNRLVAWERIENITGLKYPDSSSLYNIIREKKVIPSVYVTLKERTKERNIPKCPTCRSTNIVKQGVMSRGVSGAIFGRWSVEGRAQWICKDCGYMW